MLLETEFGRGRLRKYLGKRHCFIYEQDIFIRGRSPIKALFDSLGKSLTREGIRR